MNLEMIKSLFHKTDIPVTVINSIMLKMFGPMYYGWEPETIWMEFTNTFGYEPNDFLKDKIGGISVLLATDQYYNYWEIFEKIGKAFNHERVFFEDLTPLEPEQMTYALVEAKLNDNTFKSFNFDVAAYIKTVFKKNGISTLPKILEGICEYKTYNSFDENIEKMYQSQIEVYVVSQINKIIDLSKDYLGVDIRNGLVKEIPYIGTFMKQS